MIIPPVQRGLFQTFLRRAQKEAKQIHARSKAQMMKKRELAKIELLAHGIKSITEAIVKNTANFDELPPFQQALVKQLIDVDNIRKVLFRIGWAGKKIDSLSNEYRRRLRKMDDISRITRQRKVFEARTESICVRLEKDLNVLHLARRELRLLPSIKDLPTVIIAGYPNVGKSSILRALSGSPVDVQPYPFTTTTILIGKLKYRYSELQMVDTPGLLDRPAKNKIEKQAIAAIKHLTNKMVFVIDAAESTGYTLKQQKTLMEKIQKEYDMDVLVVLNKKDLLKEIPETSELLISANDKKDLELLKKKIVEFAKV